jgi:hypothetical protein
MWVRGLGLDAGDHAWLGQRHTRCSCGGASGPWEGCAGWGNSYRERCYTLPSKGSRGEGVWMCAGGVVRHDGHPHGRSQFRCIRV